ncbi:MAG: hypothetical protein LUD72_04145 [Bacteroidales bacterium]|nr:hypothetical protein [Bacteroidales bacterium]
MEKRHIDKPTIVITETQLREMYDEAEMTEYKFNSCIKKFLHDLLNDPTGATVPNALVLNGYRRSDLLKMLSSVGLIEREDRISDTNADGEYKPATMMVSYKVPKKNFDRKLKKLYIRMFETNLPQRVTEDGEGCSAGATNCDSSGQYSQPLFGIQRREIYNLGEDTTTGGVGDYQYTVPFPGDKETLARHNGVGGSVSINVVK